MYPVAMRSQYIKHITIRRGYTVECMYCQADMQYIPRYMRDTYGIHYNHVFCARIHVSHVWIHMYPSVSQCIALYSELRRSERDVSHISRMYCGCISVGMRIVHVLRCVAVGYIARYIVDTCIEGKLSHHRGKTVPYPSCSRRRPSPPNSPLRSDGWAMRMGDSVCDVCRVQTRRAHTRCGDRGVGCVLA